MSYYNLRDAETAKNNSNHEYILSNPIRVTWKKNQKELNPLSNVHIKNLDTSVTLADIDSTFGTYGTIFSSKLAVDEAGNSRGYGYVQFDAKESAEKCLADAANIRLNDKVIEINVFQRKNERVDPRKNLYLKNMPEKSVEEITSVLNTTCAMFGSVKSMSVRF